ncbi:MAG: FliA/WhiG family RNA polymerase sigma factor [Opitutales bacterium]|jgi:RNA polymerase sigma factor for flagellar operon FliA
MKHAVNSSTDDSALAPAACTRLTTEQRGLLEKHYPQIRAVVSQMQRYLPACADLDELHSVGLTGLIAAVRRFNLAQTNTFAAYAAMRIRGAILDELRRLDWMPRAARQQARQLREATDSLEQRLGRAPTPEETRSQLGLNQADFNRLQQRVRPVRLVPLDMPLDHGSGRPINLHDALPDEDTPSAPDSLEHSETIAALLQKLKLLPERHRKVVSLYYFDGLRLAEIAAVFGVTEARICQIHGQALQFLRQHCAARN